MLHRASDYGMGRAYSRHGDKRNAYRIFVGKPEGKRPLGRLEADGSITLKGILERQDGEVWTGLICLRRALVRKVMNHWVP
jgi:hypothetical protein